MNTTQRSGSSAGKTFRGSRKHILDLLESGAFGRRMNTLLKSRTSIYANLAGNEENQPLGLTNPDEWELEPFLKAHCHEWFDVGQLEGWWLAKQPKSPKGPTWDLLSTCTIEGKAGLLLVEAKAHEREVGRGGKSKPSGSDQSALNDRQIRSRLGQVSEALRRSAWKVDLNAESHYQLANRVAWAWKLAECGAPVVLLYLGFLGDTYFTDYLRDRDHWQRTMGAYMDGVVPLNLPETKIEGKNGGSFRLLIRSLDAVPSEPR